MKTQLRKYIIVVAIIMALWVVVFAVWRFSERESFASEAEKPPSESYQPTPELSQGVDEKQEGSDIVPNKGTDILDGSEDDETNLTLEPDYTGTIEQTVKVGEKYVAVITVNFQYEKVEDRCVITAITGATARSKYGWQYVAPEALIDEEKTSIQNDGTSAAVMVTYYASIGEGDEAYDTIIEIDLTNH